MKLSCAENDEDDTEQVMLIISIHCDILMNSD